MMWWALFSLVLLAIFAWKFVRVGPAYALGFCTFLSLLAPTWLEFQLAGISIGVRAAVAAVGLIVYCCHPQMWPRVRTPWVIADWAMVALGVVHVFSDVTNVGFGFDQPLRALGEWGLPYITGRQAVQNLPDARRLTNVACIVAIILAGIAATESIARDNPVNSITGARPTDRTPTYTQRMGLVRAEGPTIHPIWFGMLQFLLFPWVARAGVAAWRGTGPRWLLIVPVINATGIFFTLSRGPMMAFAIAVCILALCRLVRWRKLVCGVFALLLLVGFLGRNAVLYVIGEASSDDIRHRVVIDGEVEEFSSGRHRLLVFRVYKRAIWRAGWLGFGTDATTTFPVRVPMGVMEAEALERFWSIDDFYLLLQLRFGLLGVLTFATMGFCTAAYSLIPAWRPNQEEGVFLAALGGTIASTLLILWIEWMPTDFGFLFLWLCGVSSSFKAFAPASLTNDGVLPPPRRRHRSRRPEEDRPSSREHHSRSRHRSRRRDESRREEGQREESQRKGGQRNDKSDPREEDESPT